MREITLTNTLQCAEPRYSINTHISISWFLPQSSLRVFFFFFIRCFSSTLRYASATRLHITIPHQCTGLTEIGKTLYFFCFCVWRVSLSCGELTPSLSSLLFFINSRAQKKKNTEILPRGTLRVKFGPKLNAELFLPSEWKKKKKEAHLLRYPRSENRNIGYNHRWSCLGYLRRQ